MDFHKTYNIEIKLVIGPENTLFAGVCVHFFSPEILRVWGREGVNVCATGVFHYTTANRTSVMSVPLGSSTTRLQTEHQ